MPLSIFGFRALWSPYFMIFVLLLIVGYFYLTVKRRHKYKDSEPLTTKQAILFTTAMLVLYIIKGSPVDLIAHIMFSFHMIQMAFLYFVIPLLLIPSIPNWVWKRLISYKFIQPLFRFFTKPLLALIFFNGLFSVYHIPMVMDAVKMNIFIHSTYTVVLFIFSIFLWWPLMNQLAGRPSTTWLKENWIYTWRWRIANPGMCADYICARCDVCDIYRWRNVDEERWRYAFQAAHFQA